LKPNAASRLLAKAKTQLDHRAGMSGTCTSMASAPLPPGSRWHVGKCGLHRSERGVCEPNQHSRLKERIGPSRKTAARPFAAIILGLAT
jgi:hypothetical protein